MNQKSKACESFQKRIKENEYPGRGIVIGMNQPGTKFVQIYWIMGRSPNSRNRQFVREDDALKTSPVDVSKVANPELIIYNAIRRAGYSHIVTNGNQTDTIYEVLKMGGTLEMALATRSHEPDAPNFTPRISGLLQFDKANSSFRLSIIKQSVLDDSRSTHQFYRYNHFAPGFGMCIHTYQRNGNPLPPFEGEPYLVPIPSSIKEIGDTFYDALNPDNRISLAVKSIDVMTGMMDYYIINKHN